MAAGPRRRPGQPSGGRGQSQPRRRDASGSGGGGGRQPGAAARDRRGSGQAGGGRQGASAAPGRTAGLGGEQVEGRQAVRELLAAGRRTVHEVWLAEGRDDAGILDEIDALASRSSTALRHVGAGRLAAAARTDAAQGVIAFADPLPELDLEELVAGGGRPGTPFLVVLDGVTDPHNLGAVFRCAECAGATGVVLPKHRSVHVTPTVAKVAAGAVEWLPVALVPGIPTAVQELRKLGVWTVGLAGEGPVSLFGVDLLSSPLAIVLGSEGDGLSRLTRQRCDMLARIPLAGSLESLNVAAAAAVACFEVARRRGAAASG